MYYACREAVDLTDPQALKVPQEQTEIQEQLVKRECRYIYMYLCCMQMSMDINMHAALMNQPLSFMAREMG